MKAGYLSEFFAGVAIKPLDAAKTTCKDRWRLVLAEAERTETKHLVSLEAAISTHQTDQMVERSWWFHAAFTRLLRLCRGERCSLLRALSRWSKNEKAAPRWPDCG